MSTERNVAKNITLMAMSMFLPNILNLAFAMLAARILLNTGLNDYDAVIGYISLFALMSDLGTTSVFVRDAARDPSRLDKYFPSYYTMRLFLAAGFIAGGVLIATTLKLYPPAILNYLYIAAVSQLVFQVAQIYTGPFQAMERMKYVTIGTIAQTLVYILLGFAMIWQGLGGMGVEGLLYATLASNIVMFVVYALFVRRTGITNKRIELDPEVWKYFKGHGGWFALISVFNVLYGYVDRVLVSLLRYGDVANYTRPYNLVSSLAFISTSYVYVVFPLFSRMGGDSNKKYAYERSLKYLLLLILSICVGTTMLADRIIYFIYGVTFADAIPVLQVLIWILAFGILNTVGSPILSSTHREKMLMINLAACTLMNIVLNLLLVPGHGAVGASVASLLAVGVFNMALTYYFIKDDLRGISIGKNVARTVISALVMGAALYFIDLNNLLLSVLFGALVYGTAAVVTGAINRDDIELAMDLVRGKSDAAVKEVVP